MAEINNISYQQSAASGLNPLQKSGREFNYVSERISRIAADVFGIQDVQIDARLTADRLEIIQGGTTHVLSFNNGLLTVNGADVQDRTYEDFAYLLTLLRIESPPIAAIAQPSMMPVVTRGNDGSVNITINMGTTYNPQDRQIENLTAQVAALQQAIAAPRVNPLQNDLDQMRTQQVAVAQQIAQLVQQQNADRELLRRYAEQIAQLTQEINRVNQQLAADRAAIDASLN
jgi:Skp family chaperone for outer membrane proteins